MKRTTTRFVPATFHTESKKQEYFNHYIKFNKWLRYTHPLKSLSSQENSYELKLGEHVETWTE